MGVYELSDVKANGAPRFVKRLAGGGVHYLFRTSDTGKWVVTNDESNIAKNVVVLRSSRAADLPSESGLAWQYGDGSGWPDDPNLRCTEVGGQQQRHQGWNAMTDYLLTSARNSSAPACHSIFQPPPWHHRDRED